MSSDHLSPAQQQQARPSARPQPANAATARRSRRQRSSAGRAGPGARVQPTAARRRRRRGQGAGAEAARRIFVLTLKRVRAAAPRAAAVARPQLIIKARLIHSRAAHLSEPALPGPHSSLSQPRPRPRHHPPSRDCFLHRARPAPPWLRPLRLPVIYNPRRPRAASPTTPPPQ